jgi:hypothetical protein
MDPDKKTFMRRYAICAGLLAASCVVFPLLVLGVHRFVSGASSGVPIWLANVLFLWPQYVLWPNGIAERGTEAVHWAGALPLSSAAFWLAAIAAYAWCLRRVRLLWVVVAFFPAVAAVAQLALWALWAFGFHLVIDSL